MSRTLTTAVNNAKNSSNTYVCYLCQFGFASGTVYLTNLPHNITWGANEYIGLGNLSNIEEIKESEELEAIGLRFILSGANQDLVNIALQEHIQGKPVNVYVAFTNDSTIINDPVLEWSGRIDTMVITESDGNTSIALNAESRIVDFERPNSRRFNSVDHNKDYPSDKFFDFVEKMVEKEIVWPSKDFFK